MTSKVHPFHWTGKVLLVLDQRDLPHRIRYIRCRTHAQVADTIRDMALRGAPAIGCAAAYGFALASREKKFRTLAEMSTYLEKARRTLAATRPTAVNLFWALDRMETSFRLCGKAPLRLISQALIREATAIYEEDIASCKRIGDLGASLLPKNAVVLTHCNAGALATAGYGTALGVVRSAHSRGKIRKVYVDETRPYLQGARLTAWECKVDGIPYEILTDNMAGHMMKTQKISAVIVGADRIAANGDAANKIGTYSLAILAKHHGIPFYVAAPFSTVDLKTPSGDKIVIEERSTEEVVTIGKTSIAPKGSKARHPAFDVTPAKLITAIITERGVMRSPYAKRLQNF